MEPLTAMVLGLGGLVLLAAVGITSLAAFGIMAVLGILTEMSFKRLFFVSYGLGLLAPLLLGGVAVGVVQDADFQREIGGELRDNFPYGSAMPDNYERVLPELEDIRRGAEDGTMEPEEVERRLKELFPQGQTEINGDAVRALIDSETQPSEPDPTGDQ